MMNAKHLACGNSFKSNSCNPLNLKWKTLACLHPLSLVGEGALLGPPFVLYRSLRSVNQSIFIEILGCAKTLRQARKTKSVNSLMINIQVATFFS